VPVPLDTSITSQKGHQSDRPDAPLHL